MSRRVEDDWHLGRLQSWDSGGYGAQGLVLDISQAEKPLLVFKGPVSVGVIVKWVHLFASKHQAGQASE